MEALAIILIITFTFSVIFFVELVIERKPLIETEASNSVELAERRKKKKYFTSIFAGIFLAMVFSSIMYLTDFFSIIGILVNFISTTMLTCHGLIKIVGSKMTSAVILSFVFIIELALIVAFNLLILIPIFVYIYFCGLVMIVGFFSFVYKKIK